MMSMVSGIFFGVRIGVMLTAIGSTLVRLAYNDNALPDFMNSTMYDTACANLVNALAPQDLDSFLYRFIFFL